MSDNSREKYFDGSRVGDGRRNTVPGERKTFEVAEIWETHHEVMRRLVLGQKGSVIAKELGVTEAMVSYTRNSKIVQDQIAIMEGARDSETLDLAIEIRNKAPQALKVMEDVLENNDDNAPIGLRVNVAKDWLDRAGYSPVRKIQGEFLSAHLTGQEIEDIKNRAKEARGAIEISGEVNEVEV